MKGFEELTIDVLAHRNSVAELGNSRIAVVSRASNRLFAVDLVKGAREAITWNVVGVPASSGFSAVARTNAMVDIFTGDLTACSRPRLTIHSYSDSIRCRCVSEVSLP